MTQPLFPQSPVPPDDDENLRTVARLHRSSGARAVDSKVLLLAHGVGFGQPRQELGGELTRVCQPERMYVIAGRQGFDASKARGRWHGRSCRRWTSVNNSLPITGAGTSPCELCDRSAISRKTGDKWVAAWLRKAALGYRTAVARPSSSHRH